MREDKLIRVRDLQLALTEVRGKLRYEINDIDDGKDLKPICYNAKMALEEALLVVNNFIKQEEEEEK